jgi:hypothetical protein
MAAVAEAETETVGMAVAGAAVDMVGEVDMGIVGVVGTLIRAINPVAI